MFNGRWKGKTMKNKWPHQGISVKFILPFLHLQNIWEWSSQLVCSAQWASGMHQPFNVSARCCSKPATCSQLWHYWNVYSGVYFSQLLPELRHTDRKYLVNEYDNCYMHKTRQTYANEILCTLESRYLNFSAVVRTLLKHGWGFFLMRKLQF